MKYSLDASAVIAYFGAEKGGNVVRDILIDNSARLTMHGLNACEVFYHFVQRTDETEANRVLKEMLWFGIDIVDDFDPKLWKAAGLLKARYRLSLADAIGVASATRMKPTFVTSDHGELDALDAAGACKFLFFR